MGKLPRLALFSEPANSVFGVKLACLCAPVGKPICINKDPSVSMVVWFFIEAIAHTAWPIYQAAWDALNSSCASKLA